MTGPEVPLQKPQLRYGPVAAAGEVLLLVCLALFGKSALRAVPFVGAFGAQIVMLAVAVYWIRRERIPTIWKPSRMSTSRALAVTAGAAAPCMALAAALLWMRLAAEGPMLMHTLAANLRVAPFHLVAGSAVGPVIMVPLAEELAFRQYIYGRLRRSDEPGWVVGGRWTLGRATVVSSALFAAIHLVNVLFAPSRSLALMAGQIGFAFLFGLIAVWLLERTGSLLGPVLVHGATNLVPTGWLLLLWLGERA